MPNTEHDSNQTAEVKSLEDLVVTYDMKKILAEAKVEFESIVTSRELIEQRAIGSFFNLDLHEDERN